MSISTKRKEEIKGEFGKHPQDTGSIEVQIALLSERINRITEHLKKNKKDEGSKKGLREMVSRRKRMLDYLRKKDIEKYRGIIEKLGLRG